MKTFNIKSAALALGLVAGSAFAANQGSLGTNSTGDLNITLDIAPLVQVNNLTDLDLGSFSGTGNLTGSDSFCVYRNGTGTYSITMTGSGNAGAFTLANGTNTLPYSVSFNNGGANAVTAGTALTGQSGAETNDPTCASGDNVSLDVQVNNSDLAGAPSGTYSGILTVVVAAE